MAGNERTGLDDTRADRPQHGQAPAWRREIDIDALLANLGESSDSAAHSEVSSAAASSLSGGTAAGGAPVRAPRRHIRKPLQAGAGLAVARQLTCAEYEIPASAQGVAGCSEGGVNETNAIAAIVRELAPLAVPLQGYAARREAWLTAHFALNHGRGIAPMFRERLQPSRIPSTVEQATYSLDRQVIDLHWLHCNDARCTIDQAEFATLLTDARFDWDSAADFALAHVTAHVKASRWLALGQLDSWQMACLHTNETRKRLSVILNGDRSTKGRAAVRAALRDVYRGKEDSRQLIDADVAHWMTDRMLSGCSAAAQAVFFAQATGTSELQPHLFKRKQNAALSRIKAAMRS